MSDPAFRVYGLDRQIYGPVPVATLLDWARDGRIQRDTWIHLEAAGKDSWVRAADVEALQPAFAAGVTAVGAGTAPVKGVTGPAETKAGVAPKVLGRLKLFAEFTPEELEPFARAMIEESYRPFSYVVQQGSQEDGMYFVLQGRLGVATRGHVTEQFLAALNVGDTFGEMSLFDAAPRSADVRADTDVVLLRLTSGALTEICRSAPAAANRFLWNVARLLSTRVRLMDRRAVIEKDLGKAAQVAK